MNTGVLPDGSISTIWTVWNGLHDLGYLDDPFHQYVKEIRAIQQRRTGGFLLRDKPDKKEWLWFGGYCPGSMPRTKRPIYNLFKIGREMGYTKVLTEASHNLSHRICDWLNFCPVEDEDALYIYDLNQLTEV